MTWHSLHIAPDEIPEDRVHCINGHRRFYEIMRCASRLNLTGQQAWARYRRIRNEKGYAELLETIESGEKVEWGCDEWKQQMRLYDIGDDAAYLVEVSYRNFSSACTNRKDLVPQYYWTPCNCCYASKQVAPNFKR